MLGVFCTLASGLRLKGYAGSPGQAAPWPTLGTLVHKVLCKIAMGPMLKGYAGSPGHAAPWHTLDLCSLVAFRFVDVRCSIRRFFFRMPFGDHPLKLERDRED